MDSNNVTLKKNDEIELKIDDMGIDGEGIGHYKSITFFVKDAVIGDYVRAKVMKMKKNYGYARLEQVLSSSEFRTQPKCEFYRKCGGCQLQSLKYEKQLDFKYNKIENNLHRIGGFDSVQMLPVIGMEEPFFYRNKAQFPIGNDKDGNPVAGFYAGRTHNIIANTECFLGVPENKTILEIVLDFMESNNIAAYDEKKRTGVIRHVLIRKGFSTGQIMVCIVINADTLKNSEKLVRKLCELENMTSISLNINKENTNVILGKKLVPLFGPAYIYDYIGDIKFQISPLSFYQVNPVQTKKLYDKVIEFAQFTGNETVWDLYCGIGTISLYIAGHVNKVFGVEIVPQAIDDAIKNAEHNNIKNAKFYVGKAEKVVPDLYKKEGISADVVIVDPPRKGCDNELLDTIIEMAPCKIIYVSCDSATLARDLKILCDNGYELQKVQGVDQFAQTCHVETVVLLSHKKPDGHINVKVEFGEGDGKVPLDDIAERAENYKPKERVTYKMIKEYIEAKYGFKVHTAYISEVKRELGLPMYDAPNAVAELKNPRKHPTPEKVDAIKDALKHFEII